MRFLSRSFRRLLNVTTRHRADERLREEIEWHIAALTEENILAGMTPRDAGRHARLKFGSVETIRESYRAEEGLPSLESLLFDVRYALRALRKSPAFTIVALITLTLSIGANVVVFGVLNAVLLRPLQVSDPQNLYQLRHKQWMTGRLLTTSYPAFDDLRRRNSTFSGMAAIYGYAQGDMSWRNIVMSTSGDEVTSNYFDLLGVQPQIGRLFHPEDKLRPKAAPYIVLSDQLWQSRFHRAPDVVGSTVEINKHTFTVIGIAPAQFHGTEKFSFPDFWIPMRHEQQVAGSDDLQERRSELVTVIGRLKPGVTSQQATDDLNTIEAQLSKEHPETDDGQPLRLIHPGLIGDEGDVIRGFLYSVTLLALLVLLAACANLATLFAARTADRSRELALRVALGSSRQRLMRQLLTEAVLVSLVGGAVGLVGAHLLLEVLNRSSSFTGALTGSMDAPVYLAGVALTMGSALLFGMVPAWRASRSSPLQMMKDSPVGPKYLRRFALRDLLLGAQIAICTLLVMAAFVAARGMLRTLHTPLGFQPHGATLVNLDLSQMGRKDDASAEKANAIVQAALNIPGVTAAGSVNRTPMTGGLRGTPVFRPETKDFKLDNSVLAPYVFTMSPGYLQAAGTRLLSGRDVSWQDNSMTPYVAVVNQTFAQAMWGETSAIGQRFIVSGHLTEVVGVAEDGKYHDMQETPQPVAYLPMLQGESDEEVLIVRSKLAPSEIEAQLERSLNGGKPSAPITAQRWDDTLAIELFPARAATVALGILGLLAAALAVTGVFGMAAYNVSRRMKELGIRVALGARKMQVMRAAVGRPMLLLGVGSSLGMLAGVFASSLLGQIVYKANPSDPAVVGGTILTMTLLGAAASAIPARRALSADPSKLMRQE
jgi:predicted permease